MAGIEVVDIYVTPISAEDDRDTAESATGNVGEEPLAPTPDPDPIPPADVTPPVAPPPPPPDPEAGTGSTGDDAGAAPDDAGEHAAEPGTGEPQAPLDGVDGDPSGASESGEPALSGDAPATLSPQAPEDAPSEKCGPGTELVDGACVSSATPEPAGQAPAKSDSTRLLGTGMISGVGAGFLVAGIVAIPLALIARAHGRNKKKK